jgi:hypothetical protein
VASVSALPVSEQGRGTTVMMAFVKKYWLMIVLAVIAVLLVKKFVL